MTTLRTAEEVREIEEVGPPPELPKPDRAVLDIVARRRGRGGRRDMGTRLPLPSTWAKLDTVRYHGDRLVDALALFGGSAL